MTIDWKDDAPAYPADLRRRAYQSTKTAHAYRRNRRSESLS